MLMVMINVYWDQNGLLLENYYFEVYFYAKKN